MSTRIGFIGIGLIGRPLVESMLRAGLAPTVFDLDAEPLQAVVGQGATGATSVAEVARSQPSAPAPSWPSTARCCPRPSCGPLPRLPRTASGSSRRA